MAQAETINVDVTVIGGGIAGLWLANMLKLKGYSCLLLESEALGSAQTVASQGMIHGGIKYTLGGALSGASEAIADMPQLWRDCMAGTGPLDLSGARLLSDHFYLFSSASTTSRMTTFLASKMTRGRVEHVAHRDAPAFFQHPEFSGSLYRLVDLVLDVPSVTEALAAPLTEQCKHVDWDKTRWQVDDSGRASLLFEIDGREFQLSSGQFVLTAGAGNEQMLEALGCDSPKTQRRPLHQVMVKHRYPYRFYGHCLGAEKTPRLTISSHPCADDSQVWYLGGSLAEHGVQQSEEELIAAAKRELADLLPWVDLSGAEWATLRIDRAEPRQLNFARPDKAAAMATDRCPNVIAAWPTKLTLAPNLADEVIGMLEKSNTQKTPLQLGALERLAAPGIAPTPWELAFNG